VIAQVQYQIFDLNQCIINLTECLKVFEAEIDKAIASQLSRMMPRSKPGELNYKKRAGITALHRTVTKSEV
jgi:hypothetical protein